jgi:hypothetical protein
LVIAATGKREYFRGRFPTVCPGAVRVRWCERDEGRSALFCNTAFLDRRSIVKAFIRGLCTVFVAVGLLGVTGCGPDNETEAEKLAKTAGDPGAPAPGTKQETPTPPAKTQQEYYKRIQANQDKMKQDMGKK